MVRTFPMTFICPRTQFLPLLEDVFTTTWDETSLFTYTNLGAKPVNFSSSVPAGQATIAVNQAQVYQTMDGFGAALTDSSAELMYNMKVRLR